MSKYGISDFKIGDKVYHLSNTVILMIVIEINNVPDQIACRWLDKSGQSHVEKFLPQELGKARDLGPN